MYKVFTVLIFGYRSRLLYGDKKKIVKTSVCGVVWCFF